MYYKPKTKKILKKGLFKALLEGKITQDEYDYLSKVKINTDYDGNFRSFLGSITIAPGYKGQDGGFSLFHEIGHELSGYRAKLDDSSNAANLAQFFATHGKDYKYGNTDDLERLQLEFFADDFGFNLAGSKSLNFGDDFKNPDLINRFKHYLNRLDYDDLYFKALKNNNLEQAQELRNLHYLKKSNNLTVNTLYRGSTNPNRTLFNLSINDPDVGEMFGIYLTPDKKYAKTYGFVKPYYIYGNKPLYTTGRWSGVIDYNTYRKLSKLGFDHVINSKFDTSLFGNKRPETIIFNPNNIKSAEVITYDDLGNIIPLSKRDNLEINDIRFKLGGKLISKHQKGKKILNWIGNQFIKFGNTINNE